MKKLLISGDTEIACCVLEDNGSIQRLKAESILRATFCVPQKDGVFTVFEGNDASSFVRLDRELREIDRLEISGAALCHLWYCEQTKTPVSYTHLDVYKRQPPTMRWQPLHKTLAG